MTLRSLGPYELTKKLADGESGETYRGHPTGKPRQLLCIKRLAPQLAADSSFLKRLRAEARIAQRFQHVNLVEIVEAGNDGDEHYLVTEYIEGRDVETVLDELVGKGVAMPENMVVSLMIGVCRALSYIHELCADDKPLNLIHRGVSPRHVLISFNGEVKLLDTGMARAAGSPGFGEASLAYMAPEQVGAGAVDRRSDIFAVGVMMHELLTGRRLFAGVQSIDEMRARLDEPLPSPSSVLGRPVEANLERICLIALDRNKVKRYPTCEMMLEQLERFSRQRFSTTTPVGLEEYIVALFGDDTTAVNALKPDIPRSKREKEDSTTIFTGQQLFETGTLDPTALFPSQDDATAFDTPDFSTGDDPTGIFDPDDTATELSGVSDSDTTTRMSAEHARAILRKSPDDRPTRPVAPGERPSQLDEDDPTVFTSAPKEPPATVPTPELVQRRPRHGESLRKAKEADVLPFSPDELSASAERVSAVLRGEEAPDPARAAPPDSVNVQLNASDESASRAVQKRPRHHMPGQRPEKKRGQSELKALRDAMGTSDDESVPSDAGSADDSVDGDDDATRRALKLATTPSAEEVVDYSEDEDATAVVKKAGPPRRKTDPDEEPTKREIVSQADIATTPDGTIPPGVLEPPRDPSSLDASVVDPSSLGSTTDETSSIWKVASLQPSSMPANAEGDSMLPKIAAAAGLGLLVVIAIAVIAIQLVMDDDPPKTTADAGDTAAVASADGADAAASSGVVEDKDDAGDEGAAADNDDETTDDDDSIDDAGALDADGDNDVAEPVPDDDAGNESADASAAGDAKDTGVATADATADSETTSDESGTAEDSAEGEDGPATMAWKERGDALLVLKSSPRATIWLNNRPMGRTPRWLVVKPGRHSVKLKSPKHRKPHNQRVVLGRGQKRILHHKF